MIQQARDADGRVAGFGYIGHKDGKVRGNWSDDVIGVYKGDAKTRDEGMEEKVNVVLEAMRTIDSMAGSGFFPANYESSMCSRCQWGTICRRAERLGAFAELDGAEDVDL
jgi:hypothetical protein